MVPILNDEYKVVVVISSDHNHIWRILKSWGNDEITKEEVAESMHNRRGCCFYHERCHPVIVVPGVDTPEEIGTLAHEATHAIFNIFGKIDERSYDEVFAHSVGAIMRVILAKVKK